MGNIQLQAPGLNNWLDHMEQKLTAMQDIFDRMDTEAEGLDQIWESEAERGWKAEFQMQIGEVTNQILKMKENIFALAETGRMLADMEIHMISLTDQL